jgi:hypothetical protein
VASLIDRFLTGMYSVTRLSAGGYEAGHYVPGKPETVQMRGSLQPTSARELKLPSEGGRLMQYFKFYSDAPLLTINTKTLAKADVVTINGDTFKVWSTEPWLGVDIPYFKAILYREPQQ